REGSEARGCGAKQQRVVRMDDRLHRGDLLVRQECRKGRADHRLAGNLAVLLGQIPAGAVAAAGRNDDSRNPPGHDAPSSAPDPAIALAQTPGMCEPASTGPNGAICSALVHRMWTEPHALTILHCSTCTLA